MKKILLTLLLLLSAFTSVYAAEDSRWVPLYNDYNKVYAYYDHKTPEYDKKTGNITYWVKSDEGKDVVLLTKYEANVKDKTLKKLYYVKLGPGEKHWEGIPYPANLKHIIGPDTFDEVAINLACDDLGLKPILGVKEHKWLFLKSTQSSIGPQKDYICVDTYKYDKEHKIVSVHCKAVWNNDPQKRFFYEAKVNLTTQVIDCGILGKRLAAPDTVDEAIYNAAKEMVAKHENH